MILLNKRRALPVLLVGSWILCAVIPTRAREEALRLPKVRTFLTLEAITDVPLRKRPPNRGYLFIGGPGGTIGIIQKGETVRVQGKKVIRTFFGDDIWVRVKRANQEQKSGGWVYFGTPYSSPYFRRVTQEQ